MQVNKAILTIYTKLPKDNRYGTNRYLGVTELAGYGFKVVEVVLPTGVENFPECPFMVTVPCENTFVEFRKGMYPLLQVNEWDRMNHYYY